LTKHQLPLDTTAASREISEAGAPEVTPAMIQAGVDAYLACDRDFDLPERIVTDVFRAMAEAAREPIAASALCPQSARQSHWWRP
jgi:hypothetical protein